MHTDGASLMGQFPCLCVITSLLKHLVDIWVRAIGWKSLRRDTDGVFHIGVIGHYFRHFGTTAQYSEMLKVSSEDPADMRLWASGENMNLVCHASTYSASQLRIGNL